MILAVTGLDREARIVSRADTITVVGGGNGNALQLRIKDALDSGARRILSIGICGALSPSLKVGDCIVATEVVSNGERWATHRPWTKDLLERVPAARPGALAGTDAILVDGADKSRLQRETNAAAADMESHIAARAAHEYGLPFAALRVVSDSSRRRLPPAALVAMSHNGGLDILAVLRSLVARPTQIPALIRTAWETELAFRVLFRCRHVLSPGLAPVDFGEFSLDMG